MILFFLLLGSIIGGGYQTEYSEIRGSKIKETIPFDFPFVQKELPRTQELFLKEKVMRIPFEIRLKGRKEEFPLNKREEEMNRWLESVGASTADLKGAGEKWVGKNGELLVEKWRMEGEGVFEGKENTWVISWAKGRIW